MTTWYVRKAETRKRVDKKAMEKRNYDEKVQDHIFEMYKDAHLCRKTHTNACWWKIFNLLKGHLDEEQLEYRVNFQK